MNHIETADLVARHTAKILLLIGYLAVLPATMAWSLARWFEPDTMHFLGLGWLVWASVAGERNRDKFALRTLTPAPLSLIHI